jgi:Zn-dependent M28 family amino/carboxypeptidase
MPPIPRSTRRHALRLAVATRVVAATSIAVALAATLLALSGCRRDAARAAPPHDPALPRGAESAAEVIHRSALELVLRTLSDDVMEGRGPGSAGDQRARTYLAAVLREDGLRPGGENGSWEQPFDIVGLAGDVPSTWSFTASDRRATAAFEFRKDFVAVAGAQREQATLDRAELVFVGYGIQAPEYQWDDFKGTDLRGKVLVMLNNDPDWDPELFGGETRLYYGRWTYKYESAAAQGAAGAILIHTDDSAGYPWQVVQTSWTGEQFELPTAGEPRLEVRSWMTEAAAKKLVALAGLDLAELVQGAQSRDFRPVPLGLTTSLRIQSKLRRTATANVIGVLPGRDPKLSGEAVIYTAHHDHLGIGAPDATGDTIYNGARDNATGVALVLAVAKAFAALAEPPRRSIVVALVGGEEQGLLGSQYYALHPTVAPGRIAADINVDGANVLGRTTDLGFIGYGKSDLDAVVETVARVQGRTVKGDEFPDRGYFYRSDQFSFAKIGVPGLYLKPGIAYVGHPAEWGREQAELYTKQRYHQASDEYDDSWNYDGMVDDARLAFYCGLLIADADALPTWKPGDEFEAARKAALAAASGADESSD